MWDLHLHSPGTKLNDQFGNSDAAWDDYCRRLHESEVQGFGIADYFSADGFFNTTREFKARFNKSEKVFFPNIELRTVYVVNKAREEVNLHLIFNPWQNNFEERIKRFLSNLDLTVTDDNSRNLRASDLHKVEDFESATTTRDAIRKAFTETYGPNANMLDYLMIIAAANNDGIRAESGVRRKAVNSDELDKFSHGFFGNAGNRNWFLSSNRSEDPSSSTPAKPVLSGCDAHSFDELDTRLGKVVSEPSKGTVFAPTWIKSDLTYEGLKQIVFEPINRVFIGEEPTVIRRVRENPTRYIQTLEVNCVEGYQEDLHGRWFRNELIPLNCELVAIIGNKGSGKSAITDILGLLGNSHTQSLKIDGGRHEELFSFLNKDKFLKGDCAANFQATLHWYKGESGPVSLDSRVDKSLPELVEYLPQKYLERVCANVADDEFRATLNSVVFRYVDPADRHDADTLDELIAFLTEQSSITIQEKQTELHSVNTRIAALEQKQSPAHIKQLDEQIRLKKLEIEAHEGNRPKKIAEDSVDPRSGPDAARLQQLEEEIGRISTNVDELEAERIVLTQDVEKLNQLRQEIERVVRGAGEVEKKYSGLLAKHKLSLDQILSVKAEYSLLDELIAASDHRVSEIGRLLLSEEECDLLFGKDSADESCRIARSTSKVIELRELQRNREQLIDKMDRPAKAHQKYLTDMNAWTRRDTQLRGDELAPSRDSLAGLQLERDRIIQLYPAEITRAREERTGILKDILAEKRHIVEFYERVKGAIDREIEKCRSQLGEYTLTVEAGLRMRPSFADQFLNYINQSASGSFRGHDEGKLILQGILEHVSDGQDEAQVVGAVESIVDALKYDKRKEIKENTPREIPDQLRAQFTVEDIYDFIFSLDYLEPKYDLKVDKKDLSELSPGERGGLLLVFYLMLDRRDNPLIIDQPEDNLDNKSVYEILVKFIQEAKARRQIILVTHNPNLAVVADAEQIIYVSIDKVDRRNDFEFCSGSIEDDTINLAIVDILEGTMPAFDKRRLKYGRSSARVSR